MVKRQAPHAKKTPRILERILLTQKLWSRLVKISPKGSHNAENVPDHPDLCNLLLLLRLPILILLLIMFSILLDLLLPALELLLEQCEPLLVVLPWKMRILGIFLTEKRIGLVHHRYWKLEMRAGEISSCDKSTQWGQSLVGIGGLPSKSSKSDKEKYETKNWDKDRD